MTSSSEVIFIFMDDDRSSDHRMLTDERHEMIGDGHIDLTRRIGLDITEITGVTILIIRSTVSLTERIEMRTGRRAAIGQITELRRRNQSARMTKTYACHEVVCPSMRVVRSVDARPVLSSPLRGRVCDVRRAREIRACPASVRR
jgi:hypothetical protein